MTSCHGRIGSNEKLITTTLAKFVNFKEFTGGLTHTKPYKNTKIWTKKTKNITKMDINFIYYASVPVDCWSYFFSLQFFNNIRV